MWKSQAAAYEGERTMFEAYSKNRYRSTGLVQWMLNNAWPCLIWHLCSYFLRPAAGCFGRKKALDRIHIMYGYDDKSVYVVNSTNKRESRLTAIIRILDLSIKEILAKRVSVEANPDSSSSVIRLPYIEGI